MKQSHELQQQQLIREIKYNCDLKKMFTFLFEKFIFFHPKISENRLGFKIIKRKS